MKLLGSNKLYEGTPVHQVPIIMKGVEGHLERSEHGWISIVCGKLDKTITLLELRDINPTLAQRACAMLPRDKILITMDIQER